MSTKKLAKELGLLRQRSLSSNGLKKSLISNQLFSYLIVIDFESTCWREKNNYSQEIIEFPAVLLNTSTGDIESEFHTYVQPQEHPTLSEFCTELTGITQMQVEAGIPLQICLSRFSRWLQNLQLSMGVVFPNKQQTSCAPTASQKLCTFLTWSDWDLGVCLQYECKRKQLHKPEVLNSWIDLRSTYRLFYNKKPKGLNGALQDLGIQFAGREHSGLDDSRNTAHLAARMMRDGCIMKITRSLTMTPLMVKPMFGNTTADKKERTTTDQEREEKGGNSPIRHKVSLSEIPPKSCQIKSCSEKITRGLDTKENLCSVQDPVQVCQSLVSTKTLLSGTSVLPGRSPVLAEAVTGISSLVMRNHQSQQNNNNNKSLVLCSTTVGCLSNQPPLNRPPKTEAAREPLEKEEFEDNIFVETEDRCGSYDDMVLDNDDDVISELEKECDINYTLDFDSGCYVWERPDHLHSPGGPVTISNNLRTAVDVQQAITSLSKNTVRSHVNACNLLNEVRPHPTISEPTTYFAVPKPVHREPKLNQHKPQLKSSLHPQEKSLCLHKSSKSNTPFPIRHKPFMPEKTSTPNSSFMRPKAVVTQHTIHKEAPKSSFKIYSDPVKPSDPSSGGSFCTSKDVLSSLSINALSSRNNVSSVSVSVKRGQKITSPLCLCGRRAKRQFVSNGGPNHGRVFYCCPVRRSGSGGCVQKGCEFFKWESALIRSSSVVSAAARSSVSLCQLNSSLSCRLPQRSSIRKSY